MHNRGKWVILAVLALGVALALLAVWYLNRQSRQALEFWGPPTARLIVQAPQAELLRLDPASETLDGDAREAATEEIEIAGRPYRIVERRDGIATRGFLHVRRALMADASFAWPAMPLSDPPQWEYAVRFIDGPESTTLAVALNPPRVTRPGADRMASMAPVTKGLEAFFQEAFSASEP